MLLDGVRRLKKTVYCLSMLGIVLLGLVLSLNIQNGHSSPGPTISIEPRQTKKLSVGDTFTVNVTVRDCEDVYAVQVDIRYDPFVLDAISIVGCPFLESSGVETFVLANESRIYEDATPPYAQVWFVATLLGDVEGVSGSGVLFNITFEVLADGVSHIEFYEYPGGGVEYGTYFMNSNVQDIMVTLENGFYGNPIQLSVSPSKINLGENVTISGTILGVEEASNVTLYYKKTGGSWVELATILSNSTGYFSYSWKPSEAGEYSIKATTILEEVLVESAETSLIVEAGFGIDIMWIVAIVVIVVVLAVLVVILRKRSKSGKPAKV